MPATSSRSTLSTGCGPHPVFERLKVAVTGAEVPHGLLEAADLVLDGPGAAVGFLVALAGRLRPS